MFPTQEVGVMPTSLYPLVIDNDGLTTLSLLYPTIFLSFVCGSDDGIDCL